MGTHPATAHIRTPFCLTLPTQARKAQEERESLSRALAAVARRDSGLLRRLAAACAVGWRLTSALSRGSVVAAVLAFKVLEWWFAPRTQEAREARRNAESVRLPPPPRLTLPRDVARAVAEGRCPLCEHRPPKNPACTSSGVLCCFGCLRKVVDEHGRCPFSAFPCSADDVRRVYDGSA